MVTYNTLGQLTAVNNANVPVVSYTYNNRDMLVTEALSTGKTTTYAYNNSGNRTSKTVTQNSQNTVTSYTYDNANRLTQEQTGSTSISYTYDDNGRLISRTSGSVTDTFAYNGYNEMKKAVVGGVTTDYTYYVDGLRRSKKTGSNTSYEFWDGDNIIADTVSGYTIANNYIRGLRLAEINDGTATRQYTFNAHGDVTGLVDTTTGAVTDYTYDAYGNEDNASATDTNPFRYSGEYYDAETGFIYLRARYYDPSIGRFTEEDPIRDGTNWYVYCNNNPVMYVDFSGLTPYKRYSTRDEAVAGFGMYIGQQSIDVEEEFFSFVYAETKNGNQYYYYDTPRNDYATHEERKNGFYFTSFNSNAIAVTHTHGAYDADTRNAKDNFSYPGSSLDGSFSDVSESDRLNVDYYVITPAGNMKVYYNNSGNYSGTLLQSSMPKDSRIAIHQYMENNMPLLFGLLTGISSSKTAQSVVNAIRNNYTENAQLNWYNVINELKK